MVTWAFKLVKPFMRREVYESMVLKPSFAHLPSAIPKASMLRRWGGDLDFDIDAWVEWRAAEEGVDASQLCGRGEGRRFDPKVAAAAAEAAMADSLSASDITAQKLLAGEVGSSRRAPRLHGKVDKRGSGRGLFGTVRWKPKYLVVSEVGLVYFDSPDPNDKGKAARVVPLGEEGTRVELRGAGAAAAGTGSTLPWSRPRASFCSRSPPRRAQTSGWQPSRRRWMRHGKCRVRWRSVRTVERCRRGRCWCDGQHDGCAQPELRSLARPATW